MSTALPLVLFAAVLHATWNAFLRSSSDRLWTVTVMSLATSALSVPVAMMVPAPAPASWIYIGASALLQVGYSLFLAQAYVRGRLSQVYPLIRGSIPVLVTAGGYIWGGVVPPTGVLVGIGLVSGGILSISIGRDSLSGRSVVMALSTAALAAAYVTVDGLGVRASGSPQGYSAWIFLIYGMVLPLVFLGDRRQAPSGIMKKDGLQALIGGVVSFVGYLAMVSALAVGALGAVAALRETSIVFSAILARAVLGERLSTARMIGCVTVTLGAVAIGAA